MSKNNHNSNNTSTIQKLDKPAILHEKKADTTATQYDSAILNELNKYPIVQTTFDKVNNLPLVNKINDNLTMVAKKIRSNEAKYPIIQYFIQFLIKLDSFLAILIFNKGIDMFIDEWKGKRNGKFGIWIFWFLIDYLANVSNHLLKELIIKPLNFKHNKTENLDQDDTNLPHLNELSSTTKDLSKQIQNKVQNEIVDPTRDNVLKQFDQYIKPTMDQAKETYKTVSTKYETNLKENDESIPRAIYTTGLDIGNETMEKLNNKFTQKTTTKEGEEVKN